MNFKVLVLAVVGGMLLTGAPQEIKAESFGKQVIGIALTAYGVGSIASSFSVVNDNGRAIKVLPPAFLNLNLWWGALFVTCGIMLAREGFRPMVPGALT